jgi:pimeloyl-ACP methyl ester carboxylesterase
MTIPKVESKPCFLTPKRLQPEYPLFVYLPGMDGTGQLLRSQTAGLESYFDVRCLAIPRNDLNTWEGITNSVIDLIGAEIDKNSQRPIYLCGESFGGCLAQLVAVKAPQLFKRIILINPASSFKLRSWYVWASPLMNYAPEWVFDVGAIGLLPFLASLSRISESDRKELLETVQSVPSNTIRWRVSLLRDFDTNNTKLSQLTQPILLVASSDDRLLPSLEEVDRLANIFPNCKTVTLPNSGHACLLESDTNLYDILKANDFLDVEISLSSKS